MAQPDGSSKTGATFILAVLSLSILFGLAWLVFHEAVVSESRVTNRPIQTEGNGYAS